MEDKTIVYIDTGDWKEFLDYSKKNQVEELRYEFIVDENFLRGKAPGLIKRVGRFESRWNYHPITEMISRAQNTSKWRKFIEDYELKQHLDHTGLTEEDTQYGIE